MKKRTMGTSIALLILAMSIGLVGTAGAAQKSGTLQGYEANAYGTYANLSNTVLSGQTSPITLPCAVQPFFQRTSNTAGANVAGLLTTGAVDTSVGTGTLTGPILSTSSSSVADVSALGGLVSASAIKAVSTTSLNSSGYHNSGAGSSFVGLKVAGVPILLNPAPNTTLALPGVGSVVLNQQSSSNSASGASMTVNMIHITVDTALPGIPAGTQIIVGHASSNLRAQETPTMNGEAFTAYTKIGSVVTTGQELEVGLCGDTGGKTKTNSALSTHISGVLSTGTAANTAFGSVDGTSSGGETTATIQNVNLLSGLITADAVKADAHASVAGGKVTLSDTGTTFLNLVVGGKAIPVNVAPNTKISLGGLTIWLDKETKTSTGISIRMLEVVATAANSSNLPIGAILEVGAATMDTSPAG